MHRLLWFQFLVVVLIAGLGVAYADPEPSSPLEADNFASSGQGSPGELESPGTEQAAAIQKNDCDSVRVNAYLERLNEHIKSHWKAEHADSIIGKEVKFRFMVHEDGQISDLKIQVPSDDSKLNDSARRAIEQAIPLESFAGICAAKVIPVEFTFAMNFFSQKKSMPNQTEGQPVVGVPDKGYSRRNYRKRR